MEKETFISKKDAAKEVLKREKKIYVLGIALAASPFMAFFGRSNIYIGGLAVVVAGILGGWFVVKAEKQKRYLRGKYNIQ